MAIQRAYDAIVIGAGPNGLAAAITIARAGKSVIVYEAKDTIGGGSRSKELTLPGFVHDVCSAIHPLGMSSPFFRSLPLEQYGLEWIQPTVPLAHPLDDGPAVVLDRSIAETGTTLGPDADRYRKLMGPFVANWDILSDAFLGPLRPQSLLRHPYILSRFGLRAIRSARGLAESLFKGERARAIFAGGSAHSRLRLEQSPSAGFVLVLYMSGAPCLRLPVQRQRSGRENIPKGRLWCWRSRASSMRRAPRPESIPPGHTVMSPTPRLLIWPNALRRRLNASHRASAIVSWRATSYHPSNLSSTTRIISAGGTIEGNHDHTHSSTAPPPQEKLILPPPHGTT